MRRTSDSVNDVNIGICSANLAKADLTNYGLNSDSGGGKGGILEKDLGVHLGTLLIPGLLYADDIVLIAETPQQLEAMLNHATNFFRNWRFTVTDKKTQVVIFEKQFVPEDDKVYCVWSLAGRILKEVDAYKYLGVYFQSDGLWNVTADSNMLRSRNTLGELIRANFGDHGLQVGHSARLYQCCAMPQLLYGAEILTMNKTAMKKVETHLHKAARAVFR
jgi:hypothetical protein